MNNFEIPYTSEAEQCVYMNLFCPDFEEIRFRYVLPHKRPTKWGQAAPVLPFGWNPIPLYSWVGTIRPTAMSKEYKVLIDSKSESPKVFILEPELQSKDRERPPHTYPDGSLCLYHNNFVLGIWWIRQWHSGKIIAEDIYRWTVEWLANYEYWLITDEWLGGGIDPLYPDPESDSPETKFLRSHQREMDRLRQLTPGQRKREKAKKRRKKRRRR